MWCWRTWKKKEHRSLSVSAVICHCRRFDWQLVWMNESSSCPPTNQPPPPSPQHDGQGSEVSLLLSVSDSWWRRWWRDAVPLLHHLSFSLFFSLRSFHPSHSIPSICLSAATTNQSCQRGGPIKLFTRRMHFVFVWDKWELMYFTSKLINVTYWHADLFYPCACIKNSKCSISAQHNWRYMEIFGDHQLFH